MYAAECQSRSISHNTHFGLGKRLLLGGKVDEFVIVEISISKQMNLEQYHCITAQIIHVLCGPVIFADHADTVSAAKNIHDFNMFEKYPYKFIEKSKLFKMDIPCVSTEDFATSSNLLAMQALQL